MNFVGWETYEKEIEKQIVTLWRDYEKDKTIDARILRKLVQSQTQSYLSKSTEKDRLQKLKSSPEEIVLGLIRKIRLNVNANNSHLSLDSLKKSQEHCYMFLNYILEKTQMGDPIEDGPDFDLAPELRKIERTIEDIQAHIFIGSYPINQIDFIKEFSDFNKTHRYKIANETEMYIPQVNEKSDSHTFDTVDFMILGSLGENNHNTIVAIYAMNNPPSIRKLCEQLLKIAKKYPEADIYHKYISNTYSATLLLK